MLFIEGLKVLPVFAYAHDEGDFAGYSQIKLRLDVVNDVGLYRPLQFLIIVEVVVFAIAGEAQGTEGGDVEMLVEGFCSAPVIDETVNEIRRQLRFFVKGVWDTADFFQADGVGKGHSGDTGSKTTRIDAKDGNARAVIIVVLAVKLLHSAPGLFPVEGVKQVGVRWQFPVGLKGAVELQDALSDGHKDGFE